VVLSKLSDAIDPKEEIAVGNPGAKALKEGDTRVILWRSYLIYPATRIEHQDIMRETDRFLTTEEGYQLGAYMETEIHLDSSFDEKKHKKAIEQGTNAILADLMERAVGVPKSTFSKPKITLSK
jgi:hypothetical protein